MLEQIFGPFLWTFAIATLLLVAKRLITWKLEQGFAIGYSCLVASCLLVWQAGRTEAWVRFATLLLYGARSDLGPCLVRPCSFAHGIAGPRPPGPEIGLPQNLF